MSRLLFEDYLKQINKQELIQKYIIENLTVKDCTDYFNISQTMLMRILKYHAIKKTKDAHVQNIKKSKLEHFGNENYNGHEKAVQTNLKKYGVENQFQRKDLFPQIYQIKVDKYGSYNNINKNFETRVKNYGSVEASYNAQQETYRQTCLKKYGETNAAKVKAIRDKIATTLSDTFLERYGVENYWAIPGAKRSNGSFNSKANIAFAEALTAYNIPFEREIGIANKIFDFKVGNNLIEINPAATHNSTWGIFTPDGISKDYHKNKSKIAMENGFNCIHKFDWDDTNKIIALVSKKQSIGARKCVVKTISAQTAASFLNQYHIQNYAKDKIRLGLYYLNNLVAVMTFGKPRYNKNYVWELIRYCSPIYQISGGAEKLFKYFIMNYGPQNIISYCDISKFSGQVYAKLNFKKIRLSQPAKHWYNIKTKQHFTDNLIRQRGVDQLLGTKYGKGTSNEILLLEHNFVEIFDCGQATYVWEK